MNNSNIRIKEQDLVLKLSDNIDQSVWDETKYYKFLDLFCGGREYQKEAILSALKFMCGGAFASIKDLAAFNFDNNYDIREKYKDFSILEKKLPFSNDYTATLDLATGTGKSWILYAVAVIMLLENKVDQVLLLVPSITIEEELTKKFKEFATNSTYNNLLNNFMPKIINGNESISKGSICIENREAIYNNKRSSIIDSLSGKGTKTLVLSDEVHHIYYSEENKWKEFIGTIGFKYNIGVSGTCYYSDGDYMSNVIYRYSLRQAIEEDRVKHVEYVSEENIPTKLEEKWQVIYNSHEDIKSRVPFLPLTVVVTATISNCKKTAEEFKTILTNFYGLTRNEADEKVLVIHSQTDAAGDRFRLKSVDDANSTVEWIFSVSMLTEGWDVKRVFQIVPDEERAFNSKLLISQVLGRGLRVPINWNYSSNGKPTVVVFNHAKWSGSVKKLVEEVLDIERKITTKIISDSENNFTLLNLNYKSNPERVETKKEGTYKLFEKGYIDLPTDEETHTVFADFVNVTGTTIRDWNTKVKHQTFTVEEIALLMYDRFNDVPDDNNEGLAEKYQNEWPIEKLTVIINKSLEMSSNKVITSKLRQKFLQSLGTIFRQGNAVVDYNIEPNVFYEIETKTMRNSSVNANSLLKDKVIFWSPNTIANLEFDEVPFFKEVIDSTSSFKNYQVSNIFDFNTPQSAVVADSNPEKEFLKILVDNSNPAIKKWIKSVSSKFYEIDYTWRKGEHPKNGKFNPDIFLYLEGLIVVVEIKDDNQINDPDIENIGKHKAAVMHFDIINEHIKENNLNQNTYKFTMLTPKDFETFFNKINSNNIPEIEKFNSELDITLKNIKSSKE